jgi:cystathionine gamma-lyase
VADIALIAERAHAGGALVAVDNTLATPLGQNPLALGADFSISSDTKYVTGHADLLLGHVAASAELIQGVRGWRRVAGAIPGPFETWLAHRSLATMELRLERQCANALALAEALSGHERVSDVRYPGLPGDPSHEIAARQMRRFGGVVSFTLGSREEAERFLGSLRFVIEATSFGGIHSSAERRGRWGGDDVPDGLIRFSAGCENTEDLLADVLQALG